MRSFYAGRWSSRRFLRRKMEKVLVKNDEIVRRTVKEEQIASTASGIMPRLGTKNENSIRISLLKFVCAILVVAIHSPYMWNTTLVPNGQGQASFSSFGLTRIAVPFFFVCSGYFLAKHLGTTKDWLAAVRRRVRTLLVPFFIWTIIEILLLPLAISLFGDIFSARPIGSSALQFLNKYDWLYPCEKLFYKTPITPLWYLRCLFIFVLVAPAISWFLGRFGKGWLVLSFALGVLSRVIPGHEVQMLLGFVFSLPGLFYFSCGIYLYSHSIPHLRGGVLIVLALFVCRIALSVLGFDACVPIVEEISIPFFLLVAWKLTPALRLPRWLEGMSFPIYLMHMCLFACLSPVLQLVPRLNGSPNACALVRLVVGVCGPIAVALFLRRISPRLARLLFGDR